MKKIGMLDLAAEFGLMERDVRAAIDGVLGHQAFVNGPEVGRLEERLAGLCGRRFAVAVSNGTDALVCALMSLGVGAGDEVITTPFTFFATAGAIHRVGARPVFVDIEPDTFNIDPAKIAAAITLRTKLILPVHLYGQAADMAAIEAVAENLSRDSANRGTARAEARGSGGFEMGPQARGIPVLADAAQAIGAAHRDRPACAWGFAATLSFYPTKNLGGFGEGGMIVTDDEAFAQRCRMCRNHGETRRYHHEFVGGNFRLDTMKAAILLAKLEHFPRFQEARRRNAARYDELLANTPVQTPAVRPENRPAYHQYSILCDDREGLMAHLQERAVGSAIYYPIPLHLQECFRSLGYQPGDFPVSERTARRILSLPIHPMLTDEDLVRVADGVRSHYARATG